ncbi:MAG: S-layer homology domain-containing protein, partial [Candidatus Omnitrophota bacterium]
MNKKGFFVFLVLILAFVVSCAKKPKPVPISIEDNPAHHYLQGMEAIERGDVN